MRALVILLMVSVLGKPPAASSLSDSDIWMATFYQLRVWNLKTLRGPLVLVDRSVATSEMQASRNRTEPALLDGLYAINETPTLLTGVTSLPGTRIASSASLPTSKKDGNPCNSMDWKQFLKDFPQGNLLRLSRPSYAMDGAKALSYYELCGGPGDGKGGYLIFEKRDGQHWILSGNLGSWIF